MSIFNRKTKEERLKEKREAILRNYIKECRKLGFKDELIIEKLRSINVPEEFIEENFQLSLIKSQIKPKEVKQMPKKIEEDYEDEDIEETDDEAPEEDSEEAEEEPEEQEERPKKKVQKPVKEEPKISLVDIARNHEERIRNLESAIFRLKAI